MAFELSNFADLQREIFGPVLHVVRFRADERMQVIEQINASGYGLTMGVQSRIDTICRHMAAQAHVGNIYINRNQIGAIVGVQPFGGAGLSGTGPKAGGPLYLNRLSRPPVNVAPPAIMPDNANSGSPAAERGDFENLVARAIAAKEKFHGQVPALNLPEMLIKIPDNDLRAYLEQESLPIRQFVSAETRLPSPAGETNRYHIRGRGLVLSLIRDDEEKISSWTRAILTGNAVLQINRAGKGSDGQSSFGIFGQLIQNPDIVQVAHLPQPDDLHDILLNQPFDAVIIGRDDPDLGKIGTILARRSGAIIPILHPGDTWDRYVHEQTVTDNIAAAGGDVQLLNA